MQNQIIMTKVKDKTYIDFIVSELEKGNVSFERVFELMLTKFNLSRPTFSKFWKMANETYLERLSVIENAKLNETIEQEKEAVKSNAIEREKAIEMHSNVLKMIYNKIVKQKDPNTNDINAFNSTIEKYAKLRGFNAPEKQEVSLGVMDIVIQGKKYGVEEEYI